MNHDQYNDNYIRQILDDVSHVAIVGASPKQSRPSYFVLKYLHAKGYRVTPVNPREVGKEILGQKFFASLDDIPDPVDMVDIFRSSDAAASIVDDILRMKVKPKVIWMQLSVRHDIAAKKAESHGIKVVMNRCPKIEYGRLSGEIGWAGVNSGRVSAKKPQLRSGVQNWGLRQTD